MAYTIVSPLTMETDIVASAGVCYIPMSNKSHRRARAKKRTTTTTFLLLFYKKDLILPKRTS